MKLKLGKKGKEYYAGVYTGSGGISSLVCYKQGCSLFKVLTVFNFKNLWAGIIGKKNY